MAKPKIFNYAPEHIRWIAGKVREGHKKPVIARAFLREYRGEKNLPSETALVGAIWRAFPKGVPVSQALETHLARISPEARSEKLRRTWQGISKEERARRARKSAATLGHEGASEARKKMWAKKTPAQRSKIARKRRQAQTPEERSAQAAKAWSNRTPEERKNWRANIAKSLNLFWARQKNAYAAMEEERERGSATEWVADKKLGSRKAGLISDRRSPAYYAVMGELREAVAKALEGLKPLERDVLEIEFGLNGQADLNLVDLAKRRAKKLKTSQKTQEKIIYTARMSALEKLSQNKTLEEFLG